MSSHLRGGVQHLKRAISSGAASAAVAAGGGAAGASIMSAGRRRAGGLLGRGSSFYPPLPSGLGSIVNMVPQRHCAAHCCNNPEGCHHQDEQHSHDKDGKVWCLG